MRCTNCIFYTDKGKYFGKKRFLSFRIPLSVGIRVETIKLTPENTKEIERQSKSAFSLNIGSAIFSNSSPTTESITKRRPAIKQVSRMMFALAGK